MKIFKKILAWFDWSNYAKGKYELPKSLCPLFWRTFLGLLALPLVYPTHIINAFQKTNYRGWQSSNKIHMGIGFLIHAVMLVAGVMSGKKLIDEDLNIDWLSWSDPFLLGYGKVVLSGIIFIIGIILLLGIAIAICVATWEGIKWMWDKISGNYEVKYREVLDENGNNNGYERVYSPFLMAIIKFYKAIKNKYCPSIDWSEINK